MSLQAFFIRLGLAGPSRTSGPEAQPNKSATTAPELLSCSPNPTRIAFILLLQVHQFAKLSISAFP